MSAEGAEFLAELKRLADPQDLPALLNACQGRRIHMSRGQIFRSGSDNWMSRAIGAEKADELIRRFAVESWLSGDIEVPMAESGYYLKSRRENHDRFVDAVRSGKNNNEIAKLLNVGRRAVVMRKQRLKANGVDLSLYSPGERDEGAE